LFISQFEPRVFTLKCEVAPSPALVYLINKYASSDDAGKNSFMWVGPKPRVNIMNPDQIRDVFMKINEYQKASHPLLKLIVCGLASHEGEKWAKHRKIINPAFHQEKLKVIMIVSTYLPISIHAIRLP
jgi:hypothetical protein